MGIRELVAGRKLFAAMEMPRRRRPLWAAGNGDDARLDCQDTTPVPCHHMPRILCPRWLAARRWRLCDLSDYHII